MKMNLFCNCFVISAVYVVVAECCQSYVCCPWLGASVARPDRGSWGERFLGILKAPDGLS